MTVDELRPLPKPWIMVLEVDGSRWAGEGGLADHHSSEDTGRRLELGIWNLGLVRGLGLEGGGGTEGEEGGAWIFPIPIPFDLALAPSGTVQGPPSGSGQDAGEDRAQQRRSQRWCFGVRTSDGSFGLGHSGLCCQLAFTRTPMVSV